MSVDGELIRVADMLAQAATEVRLANSAREDAQARYRLQSRVTMGLRKILRAIVDADERGQGTPFAEAMAAARKELSDE